MPSGMSQLFYSLINSPLTLSLAQITSFSTIQEPRTSIEKLVPGISTFSDLYQSDVKHSKIGAVPVYQDRIGQVHKREVVRSSEAYDDEGEGEVEQSTKKIEEYELTKFVELKQFQPSGLKDQLCEVALSGVKLGNSAIEQILNEVVADGEYKWSFIDEGENKLVFLRFIDEDLLKSAAKIRRVQDLEGFEINGKEWHVVIEENTANFIQDSKVSGEKLDKEALKEKVDKILNSTLGKGEGNNDLDYQVDETELQDLPPESLPQLRKDIKDFRLKVLENEKKKREKESLEEVKRSRAQLRKLFEKFKNEENEIVEDDEDDSDDDDEGEDLTDEQYEAQRIENENKEILRKYNEKVKVALNEQRQNRVLIEEFEELKNHELNLDKTVHSDYEQGKFKPSHRDKLLEAERDEKDRQNELKEKEISAQSENFLNSINIPLKMNIGIAKNNELSVEDIDDDKLDSILEKIKPKIEGYIEEFLGMKEEELLEYILMIIKENRTKQSLVEELKETFDEDAVKIGDKVWSDVLIELQ